MASAAGPIRPSRIQFGDRHDDEADELVNEAEGLPAPHRTKALVRRAAGIKEARQVLERLPALGRKSVHCVVSARILGSCQT